MVDDDGVHRIRLGNGGDDGGGPFGFSSGFKYVLGGGGCLAMFMLWWLCPPMFIRGYRAAAPMGSGRGLRLLLRLTGGGAYAEAMVC